MVRPEIRPLSAAVVALLLAGLAAAPAPVHGQTDPDPVQGQVEEEELAEPAPEEPEAGPGLDEEQLSALFSEAEALFRSEYRVASLPLFG